MPTPPLSRSKRAGNYTVLMLLLLGVLLGFSALAVDVSLMRLAKTQAQDVADAAAHAAALELRQTGDTTRAYDAANEVIATNTMVGSAPELLGMEFGTWDEISEIFYTSDMPNSVRLQVGRMESNPVNLMMGPMFGWDSVTVQAQSTAATKSLQIVLVVDVSAVWSQQDFAQVRTGLLDFYDALEADHGDQDRIGLVLFSHRFGWEFTPMTLVNDAANNRALVRDKWAALNIASYAGDYQANWETGAFLSTKFTPCKVYGNLNTFGGIGGDPKAHWYAAASPALYYQPALLNNFTVVGHIGGCFPNMPRQYSDEAGVDHTTGILMAQTMFLENSDPSVYKAMVLVTAGRPVAYSASGGVRQTTSFVDTRFRNYKRIGAHTAAQMESEIPLLTQQLYQSLGVNTWFLSYLNTRPFMSSSAKGDGWYNLASTRTDIVPMMEEIAKALPVAVME